MRFSIKHIETSQQNIHIGISTELAIEYASAICSSSKEADVLIHSMVSECEHASGYCSRVHNGFTITLEF